MSFPLHKKLMVDDSLEWGSMKEKIIEGAIEVYKKKGPKFTMDDLATSLGMSKKTIYTVFHDKKSLLIDMVDYTFDAIKRAEEEVMKKPGLSTEERLRGILGVMPDQMMGVDFNNIVNYLPILNLCLAIQLAHLHTIGTATRRYLVLVAIVVASLVSFTLQMML